MQIIVLGMHRSGTSTVARLLNLMGAYFAPEGAGMPPTVANPKGYWERNDVVQLNEGILACIGATWQRISTFDLSKVTEDLQAEFDKQARQILFGLDGHRPWMIKDPRFCLLLPLWRRLLEVPVCVYVYRSPIQVAQSLKRRDGFPVYLGTALWEKYNLHALATTQDLPKVLISYHDLMAHPVETAKSFYEQLLLCDVQGLRLPGSKEILSFIEPDLFHEKDGSALQQTFVNQQQAELATAFEEGVIFELGALPALSAGATEILAEHETLYWEREHHREALEQQQQAFQAQQTTHNTALAEQQAAHQAALETQQQTHQQAMAQQHQLHQEAMQEAVETLQNTLQTKEAEREHYWQAWLAAEERETHYQQDIEALQTQQADLSQALETKEQEIGQLAAQARHIHKLVHWIEVLNHDITAVFNSQTWRSGQMITQIVLKLLFRSPGLTARDHIKNIMNEFLAWRLHHLRESHHTESYYLPYPEDKKKIRIAALVALHNGAPSASASVRLIQPFQHPSLQQQVDFRAYTALAYLFHVPADLIIVQRHMVPDAAAAEQLISYCRQHAIKLVYETDDDLERVFKKRDIYGSYHKSALDALKLIIRQADRVITASHALQQQLSHANTNTVCVPNTLDEQIWLEARQGHFIQPHPLSPDGKIRILYMGTKTHSDDLKLIQAAYEKIKADYGDQVILELVGVVPDGSETFGEIVDITLPQETAESPDDYVRFVHWIRQQNRWQLGVIPLQENAFNNNKTYIKFLDYSALGLASICSDVLPYQAVVRHEDNGLLVSNQTQAWYAALKRLIEEVPLREKLARQAFQDLVNQHILQQTAHQFLQAYQAVLTPVPTEIAAPALSMQTGHQDYARWIRRYDTLDQATCQHMYQRIKQWTAPPLISVLMPTYNIAEQWLRAAIDSVRSQIYPHWELCIVDDASTQSQVRRVLTEYADCDQRIKVHFRTTNGHISAASNDALTLAQGTYVALLDHDDKLSQAALYWVAEEILAHPEAQLIYSDEDKINEQGERFGAYFKCDWNPDLFLSHNLITHLAVYKIGLLREIGGFREGYEGAQDYDLALRAIERIKVDQIRHIPRVLYHWRTIASSMAGDTTAKPYAIQAAKKAITEYLARRSIHAYITESTTLSGMIRVQYPLPAVLPQVSLIIPTYNQVKLLRLCVESILQKTDYDPLELVIVDNRSDDPDTLAYLQTLEDQSLAKVLRYPEPFNYAAINNMAVEQAQGELIGLLNNDVEVINKNWLKEMVSHALRPDIGVVGARLWYPHHTLQHGGILLGVGGVAEHAHKHLPRGEEGYFGRAQVIQNFSAVTGACMVMRKAVFQSVGGLDAENLSTAFNDIDLCLKCAEQGLRILWTPFAELYHHESASRGYEDSPEKRVRLEKESAYMRKRWEEWLKHDPAYNSNLNHQSGDFALAWPPHDDKK